ncbi:TolB family protein [Puia sp. P3]|uniref:TolB family protein n=1 Tax=Puia sp. P3 TaxID=3423952 RepID=UPI003D67DF47
MVRTSVHKRFLQPRRHRQLCPHRQPFGRPVLLFPRRDQQGKARSFYVRPLGDHYGQPQPLLLNGDEEVSDPYISPDESYIIFVGGNDLFISYRHDNTWTKGQPLHLHNNDGSSIYDPTVAPDGKTLYFTSNRIAGYYKRDPKSLPLDYDGLLKEMNGIFNGKGNIFMVPLHIPNPAS